MFRAFSLNIGGRADDRIPYHLEQHRGSPFDVYCFEETMWEEGGWGNVNFDGYIAHHCTRPVPLVRTRGRPSGGVTVLLRESSPYVGAGSQIRVRRDASTGIVLVHNDTYALTLAACYFSPANSNVYATGQVSDQYLQALFGHAHAARAAGHEFLVLGDLNVRTGCLQDDVDGVPMDAGPVAGLDGPPADQVPAHRVSQDSTVSAEAMSLLLGLNTCGCVLLNGRAPGDPTGKATCYKNGGSSVVDYGIVSAGLYPSVMSFIVRDPDGVGSQDHAALTVSINLQRALQHNQGVGARCARTLRPVGGGRERFVQELQSREADLVVIKAAVEAGTTAWGDAVSQLLQVTQECAKSVCGPVAPRAPGSHAPWFDESCMEARDELRVAWVALWQGRRSQFTPEQVAVLQQAMLEARHAYYQLVRQAKRAHELQHLEQLIETYFSQHQRDFWKVLKGTASSKCAVSDLNLWTEHFRGVMGAPPTPLQLSALDDSTRQALFDACRREPRLFDVLNDPLTTDEVGGVLGALPTGKAPDLQGLTCEVLRSPAMDPSVLAGGPPTASDSGPVYACPTFVECMTIVLQRAVGDGMAGGCGVLQCSKLTPVPKPQAAQAPANMDYHRPIGVGSVMARVVDRVLQRRLDGVVEKEGIRAPTQCGFRGEHGCLDALFVLEHLLSRVHWRGQGAVRGQTKLWAAFVDFCKAFDLVRRDVLLERCQQMGVHGPFMQALVALYDRVLVRVCVNGRLGPEIETHRGTRQGSELSPLLFGLFMDLLHELIKLQVPGAGPVIGGLHVPDLMYADDVTLLAWSSGVLQQLLDCLSLFCTLFDMEVNLDKSHVMVFRGARTAAPTATLFYRGQPLQYVESCRYLGVKLHATKGFMCASDELAAKGRKALFALFPLLRLHHITQCDMRMRLFDIMVEPIVSYGAHIWGPHMCSKYLVDSYSKPHCSGDGVHFLFLRELYGAHRTASRDVLLRDAHRISMPMRWVSLAASWWEKLSGMASDRLARKTWVADIELMLAGCTECWSYYLLHALDCIGFVTGQQWQPGTPGLTVEVVQALPISKESVQTAVLAFQARLWEDVASTELDPRQGISEHLHLHTHMAWVHRYTEGAVHTRANSPGFQKLCLGRWSIWNLARYRLGGHHLDGRLHTVPRGTPCRLCSSQVHVRHEWHLRMVDRCGGDRCEDLRHFLVECPAYDHIRDRFLAAFAYSLDATAADWLCSIFAGEHQRQLARCVLEMDVYRRYLLGKSIICGLRPRQQPLQYVNVMQYPACLRLDGVVPTRGMALRNTLRDCLVLVLAAASVALSVVGFAAAVHGAVWLLQGVLCWR